MKINQKRLDIAHYFANAIVSDPSILTDDTFLKGIPDKIGLTGKDRSEFEKYVQVAVRAAQPLTNITPKSFSNALRGSRSVHARELGSAMVWATRNADMMQQMRERQSSLTRQDASRQRPQDPDLKVFLG